MAECKPVMADCEPCLAKCQSLQLVPIFLTRAAKHEGCIQQAIS